MAFAGLRGSGSWGTDERPKNFRELILWANPNGRAPLTALMGKMKKESVSDPEFNWWEETLQLVRVQVNYTTGFSTTDNTITIASGGLDLVAGDILLVEKTEVTAYNNELVEVSSITSDTVVVVKRGAANTTAVPLLNAAYMTRIGNAFQEGSTAAAISQRNPSKKTNYCQIFKTGVGVTNTATKTYARTGDGFTNDKKRKAFDHSVSMELAYMFGQKYEDTSGTFPKRFTGGLRQFITTNVTIFATTPTEDTLMSAIYPCFDYDAGGAGDERLVFCGNGALNALNTIARKDSSSRINFDRTIDYYGMNLQKIIIPQGVLYLRTHPLMNVHGRYKNSMFVINPAGLRYRPLRDTKFEDNVQAPGKDSREAQWITEAGLEVNFETTMAYLANVTYP
jgi:hypothetical protein